MSEQKIQNILSEIIDQASDFDMGDFVMSLSQVYEQVGQALQLATMFAEQEADSKIETEGLSDDSHNELVEEYMRNLLVSFDSNFNEGGIPAAVAALRKNLHGHPINISGAEGHMELVNAFVRRYGLKEFFADEFNQDAFFVSTVSEGGGELRPEDTVPTEGDPLDPVVVLPESELASNIFYGKGEEGAQFGDRITEDSFGKKKPKWKTPPQNMPISKGVFINVDTSHNAFELDGSEFNYSRRLAAASGQNDNINAMNFHPVFAQAGSNAFGLSYREDEAGRPSVFVSLNKMKNLKGRVLSELDQIKAEMTSVQSSFEGAADRASDGGVNLQDELGKYNLGRRKLSNRLDDLLAAIKRRDSYVTSYLHKDLREKGFDVRPALMSRQYEISSEFKNKQSKLHQTLRELCSVIVFIDIQKEVFFLGGGNISKKFKEKYQDHLADAFSENIRHFLGNKVIKFFTGTSAGAWARDSFCSWIARGIQRRHIATLTYNQHFKVKTKHWNYSSCSVCGKNVYTRSSISNPKGTGRRDVVEKSEYSEYQVPSFSLFRGSDGTPITVGDLSANSPYAPPAGYQGEMSWEEISDLVSSGDKDRHKEGALRRAAALESLGARRLSKQNVEISDLKYKCPYSDGEKEISMLIEKADTGSNPAVNDFECGIYIDPNPIINSGGSISPELLQTLRPPTPGGDEDKSDELSLPSARIFESKLDEAIAAGKIDASAKDRYMRELKRRAGGGWKFSNKFFNCPTKIEVPEDSSKEDIKRNGYLSKYSYIASPISGPIRPESLAASYSEDGSIHSVDESTSRVYPPSDGNGGLVDLQSGTMTYLVCGAKTSISSFSRSADMEGSLPNLLKTLMREDPVVGQHIVESLLSLGVDVEDILPFIENVDKPDLAVEALESSGRLNKISHLLAVAMATPVNMGKRIQGTELSRLELLGDIKLVCGHGHTFSIKDSVYFGRTHTGLNIKNRSASVYTPSDIIDSGILTTSGEDNFKASAGLRSKNMPFMQTADETSLIGRDSSRRYEYDEWKGAGVNDISKTMFRAPGDQDGRYYSFAKIPRTYIWGSEEGNEFSSARERETADPSTRLYLETSEELDIGGHTDASGNVQGRSAEERAALDQWQEQENNSSSSSALSAANRDSENGGLFYTETRARVGKILRSFLLSMQGFLKLATTLEIHGSLHGSPEAIDSDSNKEDSFGYLIRENSRRIIEIIVRGLDEEEQDTLALIDQSVANFDEKYLGQLQGVDRKMLHHASSAVKEWLSVGIVRSVLKAIPEVIDAEGAGYVRDSLRGELVDRGSVNYDALQEKILRDDDLKEVGVSAGSLIDEIIESLNPKANPKDKLEQRTLVDPMAVQKGSGWYEQGSLEKEGVTAKIAKMKGKEYMGRVLEASSALYLADVISEAYNLYMKDRRRASWIGYDIGLDLSTPERVMAIAHSGDLSGLSIGVTEAEANIGSRKEYDDRVEFYEKHLRNIVVCAAYLEENIFAMRTACTSSKYMSKATEYIRAFLGEMVDASEGTESEASISRARLILDNVMTNTPFTTMDLSSGGKYRRYFGGDGATNPEAIVPSFGAALIRFNSDNQDKLYPIYKLADAKGSYHSFDVELDRVRSPGVCYAMSKYDLPNSEEIVESSDSLPDSYRAQGWRVFRVALGKDPDSYSDHVGKTGTASSNKGWREGVSLAYHPATEALMGTEGAVVGYRNAELGFDTTDTMFVGPLSVKRGGQLTFPPNPYNQSHVGVPIPIDWGTKQTSSDPVFPIIGTRIPVEISSDESVAPVSIDMSDFLLRDPPEEALKILSKIEELYEKYKEELKAAIAQNATPEFKSNLKASYKDVIRSLHSAYRGLPLSVASGNISTEKTRGSIGTFDAASQAEGLRPRSSLYMPLVDWVTMHRMLTTDVFGPEWGGHQAWSAGDSDDNLKLRRLEALEEFLIKTNNLDVLARAIADKLDERRGNLPGTTKIEPRALLNPVDDLFGKNIMSEEEVEKIFGGSMAGAIREVGSAGLGWLDSSRKEGNVQKDMMSRFPQWSKGSGSFYSVGTSTREDELTGEPLAYIKLMNSIFPSNKVDSDGESPRARIERARDPNSRDILTPGDLYSYDIISGAGASVSYYPLPEDEKGLKKYKQDLKKVRHISVARYAQAISEYIADFVRRDLLPSLDESSGRTADRGVEKDAVTSFGLVKISKKLNAKMYFGGIINDEGLRRLWNLINK